MVRDNKLKVFGIVLLALLFIGLGLCYELSNPRNYSNLGQIPEPAGYHRVEGDDKAYAEYLRSLPLKKRGHHIRLYTGGLARLQFLGQSVVDLPLLSNAEQCADVCMRLRAEYLFSSGKCGLISFTDVNGNMLRYDGGNSRKSLEKYLRHVYGVANTYSLKREMKPRELKDVQPGDVFVYAAGDHDIDSNVKSKYGHAIMVADVAVNSKGEMMMLLVEGNTPARDIHVLRNLKNPFLSPWFKLNPDAKTIYLTPFMFHRNELRHY